MFWFLKFLIPKLIIKDPNANQIDALLESVDLSSYGLERVKLNHSIGLDAGETELEPQNPNLCSAKNPDVHTRILAFEKKFEDVMLKSQRNGLELYKRRTNDPAFKAAMQQSLRQMVA